MTPEEFFRDLYHTETAALRAVPYMPKGSKYYRYVRDMHAEKITALKYIMLKNRLKKFYGVQELV